MSINQKYNRTYDEILFELDEFKKQYGEFVPYKLTEKQYYRICEIIKKLVYQQNGPDVDDYTVSDNGKINRYLSHFKNQSKLLLLGVGSGREILSAINHGFDAYGTTLGIRNIKFSRFLGVDEERMVETINESLPFEDSMFDIVAGFQVFEHTFSPSMFLIECNRVLKKGGSLCLEWPIPSEFSFEDNPHHQICYIPGQARALFLKNSFTNIILKYENGEIISESKIWSGSIEDHKHGQFLIYGTKR